MFKRPTDNIKQGRLCIICFFEQFLQITGSPRNGVIKNYVVSVSAAAVIGFLLLYGPDMLYLTPIKNA
jgi:hypothetical protein